MAPAGDRPTHRDSREAIKQGRPVQRAAERLRREAEAMERHSAELAEEIEHVRSEWERKRADDKVPGANPAQSQEGVPEEADFTTRGGEEEG